MPPVRKLLYHHMHDKRHIQIPDAMAEFMTGRILRIKQFGIRAEWNRKSFYAEAGKRARGTKFRRANCLNCPFILMRIAGALLRVSSGKNVKFKSPQLNFKMH